MRKYFDVVFLFTSIPAAGAYVYVEDSTGARVPLFSDAAGTIPLANPVTTDRAGYYEFYVADGTYTLQYVIAGTVLRTITNVEISSFTDVNASNVSFTQSGTGAVARTVQDELRDRVSVKQFGATGNGSTDDTAAIVAAIATGKTVYFPNGTYVMSNTSFTTGLTLVGEDKFNTVILWKAGSAESNLFNFNAAAVNVSISNLTINSNQQNQADSTGYYGAIGGSLAAGANLRLDNVQFLNGRISDIYLSGPTGAGQYFTMSVQSCLFHNGLVGSSTRAAQAVGLSEGIALKFFGNQMIQDTAPSSYGRGGLILQRPSGDTSLAYADLLVEDNYFLNFGLSGANVLGCVYIYSGAEQVVITGNQAKNAYGAAFIVKADSGNISITNNSVLNQYDPAVGAIGLIQQAVSYTSSTGQSLVIEGNVVTNAQICSIFVDGSRPSLANFNDVVIANNVSYGAQYGIHYRNVNNARISGNIIDLTSVEAIFGESQTGAISITDNMISGGVVGIDINGTTSSANFEISRNVLRGLTGQPIRFRSTVNSFFVDGNVIAGGTTAITAIGASASSAVRNNNISGETGSWGFTGTYSGLQFENNIFSVAVSFSQRSLAMDNTGAITAVADWHYVDTYNSASSGSLYTINGGYDGRKLTLFCASASRVVTLTPDTGNLKLNGSFALSSSSYTITLISRGGVWYEVSRSANT